MERAYAVIHRTEHTVASHRPLGCSLTWWGGAGVPSQMDCPIYFNQSHCWEHSLEIYFLDQERPERALHAAVCWPRCS